MNVIEQARILGKAIQSDARFIRYAKARLANDADEKLQNAIGQFNLIRMEIDSAVSSDSKDDGKLAQMNEKLRGIYSDIMSSPTMVEYNTAKAEVDRMIGEVNTIISKCADGEDPDTCDTASECTGSCSTCGGCH